MAKGKYQEWLTDEGLIKLEAWARDGLTDEQIAENIGIQRTTLYDWKKKYPDISDALKKGKKIVDAQVENALLKRALGYRYSEDEYIVVQLEDEEYYSALDHHMKLFKLENPEATDIDLEKERLTFPRTKHVLVKRKTKEIAPETGAAAFWLKNRKPKTWRDKKETELTGKVELDVDTKKKLASEFMNDLVGDDLNE